MMSYISPIFIESKMNSAILMGIIFSFSSVVGLLCDIVFPKIFTNRPHYFFLKATLLSAVFFPLIYLVFPNHVITFLLAMAIWGIYYELNLFSSFHFVRTYVGVQEHTKAWGLIQAFQTSAYAFAPLFVVELLSYGYTINFLLVCFILGLTVIPTIIFRNKFVNKNDLKQSEKIPQKSWFKEFKIWKLLFPKVWHLLLLQIAITIIDASFWTIGAIFTQQLSLEHQLGKFLLTAYIAPAILVGLFLGQNTQKSGKKRVSIISSVGAGIFLISYSLVDSVPIIILFTSFVSLLLGVAVPELKATFENYVSRLKEKNNEMIGLQGSSTSIAYIIGPISATFLAGFFGYKNAFSVLGTFLLGISLILLFIIPKKIKMPQIELEKI